MEKYIRAVEAAVELCGHFDIPLTDLVDVMAEIPTADVKPVRYVGIQRAEIEDYYGTWGVCAECGYKNNTVGAKYCGGCGARLIWRTKND